MTSEFGHKGHCGFLGSFALEEARGHIIRILDKPSEEVYKARNKGFLPAASPNLPGM